MEKATLHKGGDFDDPGSFHLIWVAPVMDKVLENPFLLN